MKTPILIILILFLTLSACTKNTAVNTKKTTYTIVIHGGAGTIKKENLSKKKEAAYNNALKQALQIGKNNLEKGGNAISTVEMVIKSLENSPLFNAGKGAVFNNNGFQEMDASIMDGKDLSCGAVSGVTNLKNPIEGARIVKDSTKHVLLFGKRGQDFCLSKGATYADSSYFYTKYRWKQFQRALKKDTITLDHSNDKPLKKFGTVGCVVLDTHGNLAAGTSTGGLTNKKYGRIGDSPIIGAGTYADNNTCAVSCTGTGEYFIRGTIARDIAARMEFNKISLETSGKQTLNKLNNMNGRGGFIAVDKNGKYIMSFNTRGMFRGVATADGEFLIKMYK